MANILLLIPLGPAFSDSNLALAATVSIFMNGFSLHGGKVEDATSVDDG